MKNNPSDQAKYDHFINIFNIQASIFHNSLVGFGEESAHLVFAGSSTVIKTRSL